MHKYFRLPKLLGKLFSEFVRQIGKITLVKSDNKEISRDDIIDITIRIAQRTVERQTIQLSGLAADQCDRLIKGIHGFQMSADRRLHTLQIITDLRFIRSLSRLHHQDVQVFLSFSVCDSLRVCYTGATGGGFVQRLIFHVDVNSAFLSWEAARRVADGEPDLRLIPSAIGGDRDKRTGVILAKSIPAKKFGVTTGEPVAMALRKCPQLVLAKPDFALYTRNSKAFIAICRRFAPVVEQVSIDECFLDMTGTSLLYPDPIAIAHTIKDTIFSELGFTVNVGIAPNKLLAKMASDFEKPNKVHSLLASEIPQKL